MAKRKTAQTKTQANQAKQARQKKGLTSKQKYKSKRPSFLVDGTGDDEGKFYLRTTHGVLVQVQPIALGDMYALSDQVQKKFDEECPLPTYEVKLTGGEVEIHNHDATTVNTDEEKEEFNAYVKQLEAMEIGKAARITQYFMSEAIIAEVPGNWRARRNALGFDVIELSDDATDEETYQFEIDKQVEFVFSGLLRTPQNVKRMYSVVTYLSADGADPEVVQATLAMFQDIVDEQ